MTRQLLTILTTAIISLMSCLGAGAQTSLKVSLDSAYLLMGKTTPLNIELIKPADEKGELLIPSDTVADKVEILKANLADTNAIGNGRVEIRQQLTLQSFDSGTYVINPVKYISGNETISSNKLVLKVLPVPVDSMTTINDYADVADVNRKFVDYLPDFLVDYGLWILAVILLLVIGYFTMKRLTKSKTKEVEKVITIPPYDLAMSALDSLRNDKLCEQGREKEYYTRLTDILRQYLHGRFGINAMEMTSTQIRHILHDNEETRLSKRNMDRVLETADFVKFAKVRPLPDDNVKAFNSALQFVEDTKPKPAPMPDENNPNDTSTPQSDK